MRFVLRLLRRPDPYALPVSMTGLKLGDRLLQIGCGDGGLLAALAAKVGLTGRACGVDESEAALERAAKAAGRAGVLVELQRAPYGALPFAPGSFDVVVLHRVLGAMTPERRVDTVAQAVRLLREGGRAIVVDRAPRGGLAALLTPRERRYPVEELLRAAGFRAVRTLAEREGWRFTEGVRGR
jgi:ubiquinone/menaquinone biosynthesis C-methylase UbiE